MSDTPALGLPLLRAEQAQKHVTHNEALRRLDAVVQLAVLDRDLALAPAAPAAGGRYLVAPGATGVWAGKDRQIAVWQDGAWEFLQPGEGWICWVGDEDIGLVFDGAAWVPFAGGSGSELQNLALLGLGTAADATNPFSAKLNKALWTAKSVGEGGDGDLRYTLNKESPADVLSLLLQSGFSGRAEIGLVGNDNLTFKVSADGVSWTDAVVFRPGLATQLNANVEVLVDGLAGPTVQVTRHSGTTTAGPNVIGRRARGSNAVPAPVAAGDYLLAFGAAGMRDTLAFSPNTGQFGFIAAENFVGAANGTDMFVELTPAGSSTRTERIRFLGGGGLALDGAANVVIDGSRHFRLRNYTLANLPAAGTAPGQMIFCTDLGGGGGQLNSDGSRWRRVSRGGQQTIAADVGATLAVLSNAEEIWHTGALTANRALTLSAANAYSGARFRVTRAGSGTSLLSVGGLKDLVQNSWCEVIHDGAAWYLAAYGTL